MGLLAAFLDFQDARAVVIGGGQVALRRARTLLEAQMRVTVIAPDLHPDVRRLEVTCLERPYQAGDVQGARVVVIATDRPEVNAAVLAEARQVGALVNHAAQAALGNLRFPALAGRAGVQVAVGTGQELPLLAQALAARIEALLPEPELLRGWAAQRQHALSLEGAQRNAALAELRAAIWQALEGLEG